MQEEQQQQLPQAAPSNGAAGDARPSTNTDAPPATAAQHHLSLKAATNTPLPPSPGVPIPRSPLRRSPSKASTSRSHSPALGRKTSSTSLRGDMPLTPKPPVSRRSSLNPIMSSPGLALRVEDKKPLRPCDVAEEYFRKELGHHESASASAAAGTVVIVHDQCYGHRWARPKTTKSMLSMIVERPERILASVLGIAAAYVRLGDRHCHGANAPHPEREPPKHIPFTIRKTSREVDITSHVVTNVHGTEWMNELKHMCNAAAEKLATTGKELEREPSAAGEAKKMELHPGDLYLCSESLNAFRGALGGVLDAVDAVFQGTSTGNGPSRAFVCVRPPGHHCSDDHPSGFCWINNVHVGIEHAIMQYELTHAAIIDFDLHHGDGSQAITWARNKKVQNMPKGTANRKKTSIGYFSLHDINSFPCENGEDDKVQAASLCIENAHGQFVWNIHLESWDSPEQFWKLYEEKYLVLLEKTRKYLKYHTKRLQSSPTHPAPKAAIFLSAGFDASEWEQQGMQRHGTNVPTEFYARFTRDVVRLAEEEGTGVEGRVISVLEGGYSDRALTSGVLSHLSGLTDGQIPASQSTSGRLASDLVQKFGGLGLQEDAFTAPQEPSAISYDPNWWDVKQLTDLENMVNPPPLPKTKKYKSGGPHNFSSPTQSFTAKLADPTTYKRSVSGNFVAIIPPREPTPPAPDVDWVTASHTLSKLLVPFDRQTLSFKVAELAEPKVKMEKPPPVLTSVHVDPSGRQLRGRKPASYREAASDDETSSKRTEPKAIADRRKTMAVLPTPPDDAPGRPASRRASIVSSTGSDNGDLETSRAPSAASRRRSVAPAPSAPSNGEVAIKKARATATSRTTKNRPPVPRVPSGFATKPAVAKAKENEMDALTSGLKRITLKLPSKEEYELREKQKAQEAEKTAARRKAPVPRVKPAAKPAATTKRGPGRPAKASKPSSPIDARLGERLQVDATKGPLSVDTVAAVPRAGSAPDAPRIESAISPPLAQPQPVQPIVQPEQTTAMFPQMAGSDSSAPTESVEPPTELRDMVISPEQLPRPSFVTGVEPLAKTSSPARPDTPPPPAPTVIPDFVQHISQTIGTGPGWPKMERSTTEPGPHGPVVVRKQELPRFTSHGIIPFAPNPHLAATPGTIGGATMNSVGEEKDMYEVSVPPDD